MMMIIQTITLITSNKHDNHNSHDTNNNNNDNKVSLVRGCAGLRFLDISRTKLGDDGICDMLRGLL